MYHNILVPIAFEADHDTTAPIKLARLLATPEARITLMHVIEHIPAYAISYMPADYTAAARQAVESQLKSMAAELPNCTAEVIEGHSGGSIVDWAEEHGCDLIILDSHRPGMQDVILGSTATHVVRHAQCAVHVVR
ncbi:universal stress protein [Pseudooceanicola lipolyticus]|uniref:Universal stress protein n=1 Tax=Pseudooceanicola lipolyticus TaxID=2029104 RepID=A0A2M8J526_9RHOB|nr:universal stress protein [Pseudooceanicola lipolyticus]PJE37881.1 universal stress protein [Pseudooceanicola lipolyticus]